MKPRTRYRLAAVLVACFASAAAAQTAAVHRGPATLRPPPRSMPTTLSSATTSTISCTFIGRASRNRSVRSICPPSSPRRTARKPISRRRRRSVLVSTGSPRMPATPRARPGRAGNASSLPTSNRATRQRSHPPARPTRGCSTTCSRPTRSPLPARRGGRARSRGGWRPEYRRPGRYTPKAPC